MVYKRVRGWTSGRSLPVFNFVKYPSPSPPRAEAARMRNKSNRQLLVTVKRSPHNTHDRSRKDAQQKQSSVVRYSQAITAKDSRQKPKGFAAKAIVSCSLQSGDHRKRLTTEAARICSKNRQLFDRRSLKNTHERSPNDYSHTAKSFAVVV